MHKNLLHMLACQVSEGFTYLIFSQEIVPDPERGVAIFTAGILKGPAGVVGGGFCRQTVEEYGCGCEPYQEQADDHFSGSSTKRKAGASF
jgi:hypothetical protein